MILKKNLPDLFNKTSLTDPVIALIYRKKNVLLKAVDRIPVLPSKKINKSFITATLLMNRVISEQYDWDELVDYINDKTLTPVIGKEVYQFDNNGQMIPIDRYLSAKLLELYKITEIEAHSLIQAVNYLEFEKKQKTMDIIRRLKSIVKEVTFDFPYLKEFLSITDLRYFINTAVYNNVLENNILKSHQQTPSSVNFSINEPFKDSSDPDSLKEPFVFNVFGSLTQTVDPALSEDDLLEFAGFFREKMSNANNIVNSLRNKNLLILGCSFPEWMARFALRLLTNEPMQEWGSKRTIIIVNDKTEFRDKQFEILRNYDVVTYEGNTGEFIKELAAQWKQRNPNSAKPKTVFLSYTRADTEAVENIKRAIESIGNISCWFDKRELKPGDDWREKIVVNIRSADLFIPLLSDNSLNHEDGYVQEEWSQGVNEWIFRNHAKKEGKFLIPVVIDDSQLYNEKIRKHFDSKINIAKVPAGNPDEEFLKEIRIMLNLS